MRLPPVHWQEVRDPKTGKLLFKYDPIGNQVYIKRRNRHLVVRLPLPQGSPLGGTPHIYGLALSAVLSQPVDQAVEEVEKDGSNLEDGCNPRANSTRSQ